MADQAVVHIGENSPEQVAYKLMLDVASVEGRALHLNTQNQQQPADRKWILDTYAECLHVVRGNRQFPEN